MATAFSPYSRFCVFACLVAFAGNLTQAQEKFTAAESDGVSAVRNATTLTLTIGDIEGNEFAIPRLSSPLRKAYWDAASQPEVSVVPEQDEWIVSWKSRPDSAKQIVMDFGAEVLLPSETRPIRESSDGSILLPAHFATTRGEKVRYEPQSYKNTVGYWVGKKDQATWQFDLEQPGEFNVAILQGCGKGQGGSEALITVTSSKEQTPTAELEFEVLETGHFQNFQWRHLGTMSLTQAGQYELLVKPNKIAKNALMDVRAIHLVRLPAKKK